MANSPYRERPSTTEASDNSIEIVEVDVGKTILNIRIKDEQNCLTHTIFGRTPTLNSDGIAIYYDKRNHPKYNCTMSSMVASEYIIKAASINVLIIENKTYIPWHMIKEINAIHEIHIITLQCKFCISKR